MCDVNVVFINLSNKLVNEEYFKKFIKCRNWSILLDYNIWFFKIKNYFMDLLKLFVLVMIVVLVKYGWLISKCLIFVFIKFSYINFGILLNLVILI